MQTDLRECYRVLEVAPGANLEDVKRAYRELVKVWHPDRFAHDPKLQRKANEKLKQINFAYERICAGAQMPKTSGARNPSDSGTGAPRESAPQPPPSPAPAPVQESNWKRRFAQVAVTVVIMAVVRAVFLTTDNSKSRSVGNQSSYSDSRLTYQTPQPPRVNAQPQSKQAIALSDSVGPKHETVENAIATSRTPNQWPSGSAPRNFFTVGSTRDEVLAIQGAPDGFSDAALDYPYGSKVFFQNGRVTAWTMSPTNPLKVRLLPASAVENRGFFTVGSAKDEVLTVQGTPDEFTDRIFSYPYGSKVFFQNDRVTSWQSSPVNPLKVRLGK